jgi:hypothetical protein
MWIVPPVTALQPGDHAKHGRLPAPGRADEDEKLAVGDLQAQVPGGDVAVGVPLVDVCEPNAGH